MIDNTNGDLSKCGGETSERDFASMTTRILTLRELNRATLARQLLLERAALPAVDAIERLLGLQAQVPNPPYIGLWTRLVDFQRDELTRAMQERLVVRAALMRSTLHLLSADDHPRVRPLLQPALDRALNAFFGSRARGLDIPALMEIARAFLLENPRTTGELRARLLEAMPDRDGDALVYAVRNNLPLVQVPPAGTWGSGAAIYAVAEQWLGSQAAGDSTLGNLFRRYLVAFGPASVMDFQAWSGLVKLKDALAPFLPGLRTFRDEDGKVLYDLPDLPLPPADTPAPARLVPEYDNLLLSHADRRRVIADDDRPKVFLSAGRVLGTVLVDGFVCGTWKLEREKKVTALLISPFAALSAADHDALAAEGEHLLRFVDADAPTLELRFVPQSNG